MMARIGEKCEKELVEDIEFVEIENCLKEIVSTLKQNCRDALWVRYPYPPILYRAGPSRCMGPHSNEALIR